jgi:hypothetical protein
LLAKNARIDSKNVSAWISVPSRSTASGKSAVPGSVASDDIIGPKTRYQRRASFNRALT